MPSLILPSRFTQQPQQAAQIDWGNPLASGLVFASIASGPDLISGALPQRLGSGVPSIFDQGRTAYTPGVTSDGWYWPLPASHPLYGITTQDTIFVLARRVAGSNFNNLLGVPYRSGAWANPYYAWGLSGQTDNTVGSFTLATNSSSRVSGTSNAGLFVNGATKATGATRNGSRLRFFGGRQQFGSDASIISGSPDWTNKQPLVLFNRSNTDPGEGMQAHAGVVLIYNREISPAEWAVLADNPWQLFKAPTRRLWAMPASVSATGSLLSTLAGATFAATGQASQVQTGSIASTLDGASMAASGAVANLGALASTLAGATMACNGAVLDAGTFAATLAGASMTASGQVAPNATGALSATLDSASFFAGGYVGIPVAGSTSGTFLRLPRNPRHVLPH